MGNRTAKFMSALIGSIIAGAPLAAVSQNAPSTSSVASTPSAASPANAASASTANAASDCVASPKGVAPQGQHWFYRVERGTKRQCWYLRAEGTKDGAKEGAKPIQSAQATTDTPSAAPAAPSSVQNARAEYIAQQTSPAASAPASAATPQAPGASDANAALPSVATRWPDAAPASPAPQPSAATTAAPAAAPVQPSAKPAASPVTLAAAEAPADKPTGSVQMLLLVIGGALMLAGLLASVIYRFAGRRARARAADRRVNWDHRQDDADSRAPWHAEPAPRVVRPLPVDFDAMRAEAPQIAAFSSAIGRIAAQGRSVEVATAEPDETKPDETGIDYFDGEFEIEPPAPQLAAHREEPAEQNADAHDEHAREAASAADIDIITAMLERLATEGPRLTQPRPEAFPASLEADLAALARSSRGQSAARA
ncbi:hypothetical protein QA645_24715 [Bradyrhizobium sp. CIAT3101]|uniref:hypothetical protein n=1 Tax=Bradyrhizobium sp. CIAT3101 TaxID=439387 RepID=UPI0024B0DEAA|nr:hypothetical protein [Bradyrhizobium sp. CIAT3101]WFU77753.1 hypothetical protein QA645_24715 [Bradyrhizobium sp. CIAT3101]